MVQVQEGRRTFRQRWRERVASARFRVDSRLRKPFDVPRMALTETGDIGAGLRQPPDTEIKRRQVDSGLNPGATPFQSRYEVQTPVGLDMVHPVAHTPTFTLNSATLEIEGRSVTLNVGAEHILESGKSVKLLRIETGMPTAVVVEINEKEIRLETGKPTVNADGVRIKLVTFPDIWDTHRPLPNPWRQTDPFGDYVSKTWGNSFDYTPQPTIMDRAVVAIDSAIKGIKHAVIGIVMLVNVTFSGSEEKREEPEPRIRGPGEE